MVPLKVAATTVGRLVAELGAPRVLDDDDSAAPHALMDQLAQALDRAHLDETIRIERAREHAVAIELQRSLLPSRLATPRWLAASARYQAGSSYLSVGGDWYDVVHRPDGNVLAVTGDVVGHGLTQAAVMGQLRSACAALALQCDGPGDLIERLEQFASTVVGADFTTMCAAWFAPDTTVVRVANAGHPPPLLVAGDGTVAFVEGGLRPPLGCDDPGPTKETEVDVLGGSALVLYTDGLVERRDQSIDVGLERLAILAAAQHDHSVDMFTGALIDGLTEGIDLHDDVAVLALRPLSATRGTYRRRISSRPINLARLRTDVRAWIDPLEVEPQVEADALLAVGEACANAVEHGSGSNPAKHVTLSLTIADTHLTAVVEDEGRWLDRPSAPDRGRGFAIMRQLCESVDVVIGDDGTIVTLRVALPTR